MPIFTILPIFPLSIRFAAIKDGRKEIRSEILATISLFELSKISTTEDLADASNCPATVAIYRIYPVSAFWNCCVGHSVTG